MIPFIHIGPLRLGTYGLMVWLGLVAGYLVLGRDLKRRRLAADGLNMILLIGLAGLLGSKLWHLLERPAEFFADPLGLLFSPFGFAWFGALVGGIATILLIARYYRIPMLLMLDTCAPGAAIGYALGRMGCLLSGDGDYGVPTTLPWCMRFPNGLVPTTDCVHPTPIYEFLSNGLIALWLWKEGGHAAAGRRSTGTVLGEYLLLTGAARFLVEFIRINPPVWLGMTNAQLASIGSMVFGVLLLVTRRKHRVAGD